MDKISDVIGLTGLLMLIMIPLLAIALPLALGGMNRLRTKSWNAKWEAADDATRVGLLKAVYVPSSVHPNIIATAADSVLECRKRGIHPGELHRAQIIDNCEELGIKPLGKESLNKLRDRIALAESATVAE